MYGGVQRGRIKWIDSMRGIAMLFVVLGHCAGRLDDPVNRAILSFHMPLFFVISGLCIKETKVLNRLTIKKMAKAYLRTRTGGTVPQHAG